MDLKNEAASWEATQVQKKKNFFSFSSFLVTFKFVFFFNKCSCLILCFLVLFFRFLEFKVGYGGGES